MYVEFGNGHPVEGYRDPGSDDPDLVRYRDLEGEQVTTVFFPEGTTLQEAFATSVATLALHIGVADEDTGQHHAPAWIESDSEGLKALLSENYGLKPGHFRPKTWGKETGASAAPSLASNVFAEVAPAKEEEKTP